MSRRGSEPPVVKPSGSQYGTVAAAVRREGSRARWTAAWDRGGGQGTMSSNIVVSIAAKNIH